MNINPQVLTIIIFILGVLFTVVQIFFATVLGVIWWEIRELRRKIHTSDGVVGILGNIITNLQKDMEKLTEVLERKGIL